MSDWKTIAGGVLGVGAGLGATTYGIQTGDVIVSVIGAVSTMAVAIVGAWPNVLKATSENRVSFSQQLALEREALREEHRALVADLRTEIKRLRALNDELSARLSRCEKEQDALIERIQQMRQGIFSDTDLEIAKLLKERKAHKDDDHDT